MNPEVIAEIKALEANGRITPEGVYDWAKKNQESALYRALDEHHCWDNKQAAYLYGINVVRGLIRSVRYVEHEVKTEVIRVPYYVRDPEKDPNEQGYVSIQKLRTEEDNAREVILREFRYADAALKRALAVASVLGLEEEVAAARKPIDAILERLERFQSPPGHG